MRVLLISPYHGGSHRSWAEGYQKYSRHRFQFLTLPARYWKWRMHGGAVTLAREFRGCGFHPDVILATDMLNLCTFLALSRDKTGPIPTVLYMHENQLTYPLPMGSGEGPMRRQSGERDLHYAFINFSSMLSANRVVFNSRFHRSSFFSALPGFLKHFPEYREEQTMGELEERSTVLPVGLEIGPPQARRSNGARDLPLILWNQRWEYDKNPGGFFEAVLTVAGEGFPFEVALCGESFQKQSEMFDSAVRKLGDRVVHCGFAPPGLYHRLLREATLIVSTAIHEFFGVSVLEAVCCETFPILPDRLSYPEILPEEFHGPCLYRSPEELLDKLRWALSHPEETRKTAGELASRVECYHWERCAERYDLLLEEVLTS